MGESKLPRRPKPPAKPRGAVSDEVMEAGKKFMEAVEADLARDGVRVKQVDNVYAGMVFASALAVADRYKPEPAGMLAGFAKGVTGVAAIFSHSPLAWVDYIGTKLEETHSRG